MLIVNCPTCQAQVVWNSASQSRPFCSERCRLIDLGEWASGERVVPGSSLFSPAAGDIDVEDVEALLSQLSQH